MKKTRRRFRHVSLSSLLVITLLSGVFLTGFGKGFTQGEKERSENGLANFDDLIALIRTTIVPDPWEPLGGPSTMEPYPANVSSGCFAEVVDELADAGIANCIPVFDDIDSDVISEEATDLEPSP